MAVTQYQLLTVGPVIAHYSHLPKCPQNLHSEWLLAERRGGWASSGFVRVRCLNLLRIAAPRRTAGATEARPVLLQLYGENGAVGRKRVPLRDSAVPGCAW